VAAQTERGYGCAGSADGAAAGASGQRRRALLGRTASARGWKADGGLVPRFTGEELEDPNYAARMV
jgi:hypothetical protein